MERSRGSFERLDSLDEFQHRLDWDDFTLAWSMRQWPQKLDQAMLDVEMALEEAKQSKRTREEQQIASHPRKLLGWRISVKVSNGVGNGGAAWGHAPWMGRPPPLEPLR